MKKIALLLSVVLTVMTLLPLSVSAASWYIEENPAINVPNATPNIDGNIDTSEGWSAMGQLNEATAGAYYGHNPLTATVDFYFASSPEGLYFAADMSDIGSAYIGKFYDADGNWTHTASYADPNALYDNAYLEANSRVSGKNKSGYKNITFYHSEKIGEGYYASDISVSNLGTEFTVTAPDGETERFSMKLVGAHNVINVMGAIAVANRFGISLSDLKIPVRRLRPVPHRMEMKDNGNVTIIDDAFNSNPIGSKAAVETLALFDGIRILITPGMVELGAEEAEYNRKFGTYAADCCDYILLVGRKHTEPILAGIQSKGFPDKNVEVFDNVGDAINYAYQIKGQGHKYILLENDLPDNY